MMLMGRPSSCLPAGIPLGMFQSMFSIFAIEKFNLAADQNGYIMSYIGVLSMVS